MKKDIPTPAQPDLPAALHAALRDLAPRQSILPAARTPDIAQAFARSSAVPAIFQSTGESVSHMAELRIRHWILQQEADARRKQASRLLPPG